MPLRRYLWVNGINTDTEGLRNVPARVEAWIEQRTGATCSRLTHSCGALTAWLRLRGLADQVADWARANDRDGVELVVGAHSFGARVVADALRQEGVWVRQVHLVGAACESSFAANGLNDALAAGRVEEVVVHWSDEDDVLRYGAGLTPWLYGQLGYTGPRDVGLLPPPAVEVGPYRDVSDILLETVAWADRVARVQRGVHCVRWHGDHGGYFDPDHFDNFMRAFTILERRHD